MAPRSNAELSPLGAPCRHAFRRAADRCGAVAVAQWCLLSRDGRPDRRDRWPRRALLCDGGIAAGRLVDAAPYGAMGLRDGHEGARCAAAAVTGPRCRRAARRPCPRARSDRHGRTAIERTRSQLIGDRPRGGRWAGIVALVLLPVSEGAGRYAALSVETRQRTILGGLGGLLTGVGLAWPLLVPNSSTLVKVAPLIGLVVLGIAMMVAAFRQPPVKDEGRLELFLAARKMAAEAAEKDGKVVASRRGRPGRPPRRPQGPRLRPTPGAPRPLVRAGRCRPTGHRPEAIPYGRCPGLRRDRRSRSPRRACWADTHGGFAPCGPPTTC